MCGFSPTPNPAPRGGELFWARFFGAKAPKNRAVMLSPFPVERLGRGLGRGVIVPSPGERVRERGDRSLSWGEGQGEG